MKYPSKNWPVYEVRYWDHQNNVPGRPLNDCFGNSLMREIKARSEDQAKSIARRRHLALRFHSVKLKEPPVTPEKPAETAAPNPLVQDMRRKDEWGEMVGGNNDTLNGVKERLGTMLMGQHAGTATIKMKGKKHSISIVLAGASLAFMACGRRYVFNPHAMLNHAVDQGLLDDTIDFKS